MLTIRIPDKPTLARSSKWPALRRQWLKTYPTCDACGRHTKLEVHHIIPFHIKPELELDVKNLITLCENPAACCHFTIGHCAISWFKYDPEIIKDAFIIRMMRQNAQG